MKELIVNQSNNFIRVFREPKEFSSDFCFNGGTPTTFLMVDWFNPIPLYEGTLTLNSSNIEKYRNDIISFIIKKSYYNPEFRFFAITSYGDIFYIEESTK